MTDDGLIRFPCSGCGKSLTAKPELSGKRFACPACKGATKGVRNHYSHYSGNKVKMAQGPTVPDTSTSSHICLSPTASSVRWQTPADPWLPPFFRIFRESRDGL